MLINWLKAAPVGLLLNNRFEPLKSSSRLMHAHFCWKKNCSTINTYVIEYLYRNRGPVLRAVRFFVSISFPSWFWFISSSYYYYHTLAYSLTQPTSIAKAEKERQRPEPAKEARDPPSCSQTHNKEGALCACLRQLSSPRNCLIVDWCWSCIHYLDYDGEGLMLTSGVPTIPPVHCNIQLREQNSR